MLGSAGLIPGDAPISYVWSPLLLLAAVFGSIGPGIVSSSTGSVVESLISDSR